jgi:hypothetical protein
MHELQVELAKWYHPAAQQVKCIRREHEAHERVGHPPGSERPMQLVFEFGSRNIAPVFEAIRRAIGDRPSTVQCLPKGQTGYEPTDDSLESAGVKLGKGEISAFSVRPREGLIRYALALVPFFQGDPLSFYLGTIEYTGRDFEWIWDLLLATPGLTVACLGFEEGVELSDATLAVETFPWAEWPLVVGALRDDSGSWVIREGPEMRWFSGPTPHSLQI